MRAIVDYSTAAIYVKDLTGRYRIANRCFAEVLGRIPGDVIGHTDVELMPPDAAAASATSERALLATGAPVRREITFVRGDSTSTFIALQFALKRPGTEEAYATCAILTDISERKELETLKDDLVSMVSHELRTPLTSLRGFAELMLHREYEPDQQRKFLGLIHGEAVRLNSLISDFLDLQRIESGAPRYDFRTFDMVPLMRDTLESMRGQSQEHTLRFSAPKDPVWVRGDQERIRQVLDNLVGNAIKFSTGGGDIDLSATQADGFVTVAVRDQGIGIARAAQDRLFRKFSRLNDAKAAHVRGTGLGLALVKELVLAHGGHVMVDSEPGRGSTFSFTLPAATPPTPAVATAVDVLVVEADHAVAQLIQTQLLDAGMSSTVVGSTEAALSTLTTAAPPAAVLIDMSIGEDLDGWELLMAIRNDVRLAGLPLIAMSDHLIENATGLAANGAEILMKPIAESALQAMVASRFGEQGGRVLIVDDDSSFCEQAQQALSRLPGVDVRCASSGMTALEMVRDEVPDLLLLDLVMPGVDGFDVLNQLRRDPRAINLPVVVVTAREMTYGERTVIRGSLASFLSRNSSLQDLATAVQRIVACSRVGQSTASASSQCAAPTS
jgi:PAS domain S-box-containing protein